MTLFRSKLVWTLEPMARSGAAVSVPLVVLAGKWRILRLNFEDSSGIAMIRKIIYVTNENNIY